ncbi:MAG: hypothetical protein JW919_06005 [Candidatus Omnitrophica bacterium]|nr:hypothetical protein [Candidatus Omnitrophota bacterium]
MKKAIVLAITVAFVMTAMPLFAGEQVKSTEKPIFQIMADTMKGGQVKERNRWRTVPKEDTAIFQHCADGIKEGSAKAKQMSLRETK